MPVSGWWQWVETSIAAVPIWERWLGTSIVTVIILAGIAWWWWPVSVIITTAILAGAAWWQVPKCQMKSITAGDPKDRADIEDNFRKTIGQALGGIAVLVGAGFAYLQFTQQQNQFTQQQKAAHDLLISNQVAKGFEQLGSPELQHTACKLGRPFLYEGRRN